MNPPVVHQPRVMLITGGAGFIGSALVRHVLAHDPAVRVVVLDALTYAGNRANLSEVEQTHAARYRFVHGDIADPTLVAQVFAEEAIDTVIHLAAESHVDRSIADPLVFVRTNVLGTATLLHAARHAWRGRPATGSGSVRFHHVSTDEVFGSLGPDGTFCETTAYDPSSPYSASKAGADHLVRAWGRTYGLPYTLSHGSNTYGPRQFPEKLIPLTIANGLAGLPLPVYGNGSHVREWLHVDDHAAAIVRIVTVAAAGSTWCIGGTSELTNLDLVRRLCQVLDTLRPAEAPHERLITFVADRPGHDQRYASDGSKLARELGWMPTCTLADGLLQTVHWYLDHQEWMTTSRERHCQSLGVH